MLSGSARRNYEDSAKLLRHQCFLVWQGEIIMTSQSWPSHDNFSQPSHNFSRSSQITLISQDNDILFHLSCNLRIICGENKELEMRLVRDILVCLRMINWMAFNAVFNSISVISRRPVHISMLSWSSFHQYSAQYSFQATGCLPT